MHEQSGVCVYRDLNLDPQFATKIPETRNLSPNCHDKIGA